MSSLRVCVLAASLSSCGSPAKGVATGDTTRDHGSSSGMVEGASSTGASLPPDAHLFIQEPDGLVGAFECDTYAQNCPPGTKCNFWDSTGLGAWNGTRCVPLAPDPAGPGETCTVEGSAVSGLDDCDIGAMCWAVIPETMQGTCREFCTGSQSEPNCAVPGHVCSVGGSGIHLCLPTCSPLLQDCPLGQGCYRWSKGFICAPIAVPGAYGEPCEYCTRLHVVARELHHGATQCIT